MIEEKKKEKIWEIKLRDATVRTDGLSPVITMTLEDEGISLQDIQYLNTESSVERKAYKKLYKILYYLVVYSSYTDKYREIKFEDFVKKLSPSMNMAETMTLLSEIFTSHFGITEEQVKEFNTTEKKKLNSPKSTSV